jgi:hypothetical protein
MSIPLVVAFRGPLAVTVSTAVGRCARAADGGRCPAAATVEERR